MDDEHAEEERRRRVVVLQTPLQRVLEVGGEGLELGGGRVGREERVELDEVTGEEVHGLLARQGEESPFTFSSSSLLRSKWKAMLVNAVTNGRSHEIARMQ